MRMRIDVVSTTSARARGVQEELTLQLGLLSLLVNLNKMSLSIQVEENLKLDELERPLAATSAAIASVSAACMKTTMALSIFVGSNLLRTVHAVLPHLLGPLANGPIQSLVLSGLEGQGDAGSDAALMFEAIQNLMSAELQELELRNSSWLAQCPLTTMSKVERLRFSMCRHMRIDLALGACMENAIRTISLCPNLDEASFYINLEEDHSQRFLWQHLPMLRHATVRKLALEAQAFAILGPLIAGLPLKIVQMHMESAADLQLLRGLVSAGTSWLPQLCELHIEYTCIEWTYWPEGGREAWIDVRDKLRALGVNVSLTVHGDIEGGAPPVDELLEFLEDTAQELVESDLIMQDCAFDARQAYNFDGNITLAKCKCLVVRMNDYMEDDDPGHANEAFRALMRQVDFPELEVLCISVLTPFTDYLPTIVSALQREALPKLKRIEGCLEHDCHEDDFWDGQVEMARMSAFRKECHKRGIALDTLGF